MKRAIYIFFSMVLGLLLSLLVHTGIEAIYLRILEAQGKSPEWVSLFGKASCALPVWVQLVLLLAGILFGWWLGVTWWRIVYIEHRHWSKKT